MDYEATPQTPPARPHVVAMPCPFHGHTTPFLHLCELLASEGLTITYVTTPRFQPKPEHIQGLHKKKGLDIRVALIQDGLPQQYSVCVKDIATYLRHVEMLRWPLEALMDKIRADSASPPITCILSDSHLGWVQDVANKFDLPRVCFLTSSTTEFSVLFHQPLLVAQGILPFKESSGDVISCIPGLPPTQRTDFPSFLQVEDSSDYEFQYFMRQIARVAEADRLLVASFEELETQVIQTLAKELNIQPIGPIILLGKEEEEEEEDDDACEQWLDKQEPNSVIYIAFGTLANLEEEEVRAIAGGLQLTKQPFIWALREDAVSGVLDPLPPGFKESTNAQGQGLVITWAQQRRILKHPAIAAFLTHCGWGSTLESICMGIPLLCLPLYGDQLLNCKLLVEHWQAGVKISPGLANRRHSLAPNHVASAITTITSSPMYRLSMTKLQALAQHTCGPNGSSKKNFKHLVSNIFTLSQDSSITCLVNEPLKFHDNVAL